MSRTRDTTLEWGKHTPQAQSAVCSLATVEAGPRARNQGTEVCAKPTEKTQKRKDLKK